MTNSHNQLPQSVKRVAGLSLLLMFFTIPHTLEDFALGAPAEAGIPAAVLAFVISVLFFLQGAGLYWLPQAGKFRRWGYLVHVGLGLFWPVASGFAQLPAIFGEEAYRSGFVSALYVFGMIGVGILLLVAAIMGLRSAQTSAS